MVDIQKWGNELTDEPLVRYSNHRHAREAVLNVTRKRSLRKSRIMGEKGMRLFPCCQESSAYTQTLNTYIVCPHMPGAFKLSSLSACKSRWSTDLPVPLLENQGKCKM